MPATLDATSRAMCDKAGLVLAATATRVATFKLPPIRQPPCLVVARLDAAGGGEEFEHIPFLSIATVHKTRSASFS